MAGYFTLIAFGLYITCKYLLKKEQRKRLKLLLGFYILVVLFCLIKMYNMLFVERITSGAHEIEIFIPVLVKFNICLLQCWMMLELAIRMKQSIYLNQRSNQD